jgi:putative FmdB family regulatory protein
MPIYEYHCKKCGHDFEKLVPRAGTPVECEKCQSDDVEKLFSVFGTNATSQTAPAACPAADSCPAAAASGCGCHGKCHCH